MRLNKKARKEVVIDLKNKFVAPDNLKGNIVITKIWVQRKMGMFGILLLLFCVIFYYPVLITFIYNRRNLT